MQLLGGQQRKASGQVKAHLTPEQTLCARTGTVLPKGAVGQNIGQQIKILLLRMGSDLCGGGWSVCVHVILTLGLKAG